MANHIFKIYTEIVEYDEAGEEYSDKVSEPFCIGEFNSLEKAEGFCRRAEEGKKTLGRYIFESFFEAFLLLLLGIPWLMGVVIAPGWWKLLSIIPFYAWYLVVEKIMQSQGWI